MEEKINYEKIIDFIDSRLSELDQLKNPGDLKNIEGFIEINLKADLSLLPELIYFYKFRKITENFEIDLQNDINTLVLIKNLLKKLGLKTEINQEVIKLKLELINLLQESEIFNSNKIDDDSFCLWESKIKKIFDNYNFSLDFKSDFDRNLNIKYKGFKFYDGSNNLEINVFALQDRINHQIGLMLRILKNIIEIGKEILEEKKLYNFHCFVVDSPICNRNIVEKDNQVFIAYDYKDKNIESIIKYIVPILESYNLKPIIASDKIVNYDFMCKICGLIQESKYVLAEISIQNLNVGLEIGLAIGLQKKTMLIANKNSKEVGDLKRTDSVRYGDDLIDLKNDFEKMLKSILQ